MVLTMKVVNISLLVASFAIAAVPARAAEPQVVRGHGRFATLPPPTGRLPAGTRLTPVIGLPLRNTAELTNMLEDIYDPSSPSFQQYLTPDEFTENFGPTKADYEALKTFAASNGLAITGEHANRVLLDVSGSVADIERVFHVHLNTYPHPTEARTYYAPDAAPSLELAIPVLTVRGLDNFKIPRPRLTIHPPGRSPSTPRAGSGAGGSYFGKDLRAAYVPGVALTGAGQTVGLFELDGFYPNDIPTYETLTGLPKVPARAVLLDGFSGQPGSANPEVALDIEMAISMAPGLAGVIAYEGVTPDDILSRMATVNLAKQLSCSWSLEVDEITEQIFQQFAAQGQTFFSATGDSGAMLGAIEQPSDNPYVTQVGGTTLATAGPGLGWVSETVWNVNGGASSGGISTIFPIPAWQQGVSMARNGGSTKMRNFPDVAMVARNIQFVADDGTTEQGDGTSFAAPLWAGFTALVNQQAAATGRPPVGFLNPALYAVAKGSGYSQSFHDITSGNNKIAPAASGYVAEPGYDLCTGWGSPIGANLINALLVPPAEPLSIAPGLGFFASGPSGGPFNISSQAYSLSNSGSAPLQWGLANTSLWLNVSSTGGVIAPGATAPAVTVSLSPAAARIVVGSVSGNLVFTNISAGTWQTRQFFYSAGNGGFETGDFTDWTLTGSQAANYNNVSAIDDRYYGITNIPGVDDATFVHSGAFGATLGENGSVSQLGQTLPTAPGGLYLVSFWLEDIPYQGATTPNEFSAAWGGKTLFSATGLPAFGWTNMSFVAPAVAASTILEFGSRNDPGAFGLDDVSVQEIPPPSFQSATVANGSLTLVWDSLPGAAYQVESAADLSKPAWIALTSVTATGPTSKLALPLPASGESYFRVVLSP
jgi:hypothetical protein